MKKRSYLTGILIGILCFTPWISGCVKDKENETPPLMEFFEITVEGQTFKNGQRFNEDTANWNALIWFETLNDSRGEDESDIHSISFKLDNNTTVTIFIYISDAHIRGHDISGVHDLDVNVEANPNIEINYLNDCAYSKKSGTLTITQFKRRELLEGHFSAVLHHASCNGDVTISGKFRANHGISK